MTKDKPIGPPMPSREAWNLANDMIAGSVKSPDYPRNIEEANRKAQAKASPSPAGDDVGRLRAGLERAAEWHDARCKGPDVFEQELHENSAKALRYLAANPDATDMQALEAALRPQHEGEKIRG